MRQKLTVFMKVGDLASGGRGDGCPGRSGQGYGARSRLNAAVRSGEWAAFADRFAPNATMAFVGVPAGPFSGRAEIARAYVRQPPADTMSVESVSLAGPIDTVRFAWARRRHWPHATDLAFGLIARPEVGFDY
jgi:steroid Delta-isomerase